MYDKDGYLHVIGRKDDIINVAECAVIGVADKLQGEKPLGFVVPKAGSDVTNEQITKELVRTIRAQIGAFACFDQVFVMPKLPKTSSAKILRKTIRSIVNGSPNDASATIEDRDVLGEFEKTFNYKS